MLQTGNNVGMTTYRMNGSSQNPSQENGNHLSKHLERNKSKYVNRVLVIQDLHIS